MNVRTEMNERDMKMLSVIAVSADAQEALRRWKGRRSDFSDIAKKLQWKRLCTVDTVHIQLSEHGLQMLQDYESAAHYFTKLKRVGVAVFVALYRAFGHEPFSISEASEIWQDAYRVRATLKQCEELKWARAAGHRLHQFTVEALAPFWILTQDTLRPLISFTPPLHLFIKYILQKTDEALTIDDIAEKIQEASYVVRTAIYNEVTAKRSVIRKVADKPRSLFSVDHAAMAADTELCALLALHFPE